MKHILYFCHKHFTFLLRVLQNNMASIYMLLISSIINVFNATYIVKIYLRRIDFYMLFKRLKENPFFSEFFTQKSLSQFIKYVITGFLSFSLEYTLFRVLNEILDIWFIFANSIAFVIIFWFNFLMNRLWSFKSNDKLGRQLKLYGILFVINIIATNVLLYILSHYLGIVPHIAKILVMGAVVSWNFILYKKVIYK